jgi:DNA-binding GntR family transcriptional regulator
VPKKLPASRAGIPSKIAESIRDLITRGVLSPGVHLGQTELAERFGASRVPVREALKLLTAEGLVLHDPHRGFFISSLSSDEARQLYRMRHLLESELLSTVEWPNKQQLSRLSARLEVLERALVDGKGNEFVIQHRAFHEAIFELSPQRAIAEEVLRLLRLTDRYRSVAPMNLKPGERSADAERHLLNALTKRDRVRLLSGFEADRSRIEQHLLRSLEMRGL